MANFNKIILVGRLTRDPESRSFANGGKVTKIGFAVTNRKKNSQTGAWEDEPMFIDCDVFNRGETGKMADLVADRCRKGTQIMIEGRLHLETWDDKNGGGKRSKHKIVIENVQLLDPKPNDGSAGSYGGGGYSSGNRSGGGFSSGGGGGGDSGGDPYDTGGDQGGGGGGNAGGSASGGGGDDIPF